MSIVEAQNNGSRNPREILLRRKYMEQLVIEFVLQYPAAASALLTMSILRAVFKPLQGVVDRYVEATPDPDDDSRWAKIKESKPYQAFAWLVDYTASIKLPVPKKFDDDAA